ncbi:MAG TPA: VTT domain-containing protein [Bryobacteraceae bacterium]|nr:VTT domain-containing protein [Bryobacteraceae bacterium]
MSTLLQLTYSGLFLAVLAQQLGLPIPSVVFLMAAGALAARGVMSPTIILLLGVLGCLGGDGAWYWIGRKWGSKAMRLICRFTADPQGCSKDARQKLHRYGLPVMCAAKFIPGLDAVMPPLAGAERVPLARFLALDAIGSLLWSACYGGLGYVFANQLEIAIRWVQHCGTALGIAIAVPIVLYAGWRGLTLVRMILELRQRHISPPMLARKLKSDRRIAVVDLTSFEGDDSGSESVEGIPGAFVLDPSELRKAAQIAVPDDVEIILYCPSGSDAISARVAVGLRRIGVNKVWVLEGGLKAWREHGFPVSQSSEGLEAVAARLGVKLPADTRPN